MRTWGLGFPQEMEDSEKLAIGGFGYSRRGWKCRNWLRAGVRDRVRGRALDQGTGSVSELRVSHASRVGGSEGRSEAGWRMGAEKGLGQGSGILTG